MELLKLTELFPRVMFYRDTGQWEKARACYHPDDALTHIKTSWFDGTIDGWIAGQTKIREHANTRKSSHLVQPVETMFNESQTKAVLVSVGNVSIRTTVENVEVDIVSWCRFLNRAAWVEPEGQWKLLSFEAIYDRDSVVATDGASLPQGLVKVPEGARSSYKNIEWVLSLIGLSIARDLPGTDRPETGDRIFSEAEKWLHAKDQ